ncbi:hypothetical protein OPKNFCMD_1579 [Methylobacterium crusticola]|uniref:DUF4148 domain-containing protein n=1 Tax=Methylobacterium crusticola TaxID=1697972 RepID=A0ABQ4QU46_9HYPH|nr:hypothetical protein [Methylobacterium crusticola]GJD48853.1 hypothetical protein OPKNFCMD_1579 [Methylobacterium crusticola]
MSGRSRNSAVRVLALATSLAGATVTGAAASAQDAITLETIGAVRIASPEEARQRMAEQEGIRPQAQEQPRREVRDASVH